MSDERAHEQTILPGIETRVLADRESVSRAAAELFSTLARTTESSVVALSGGSTPRRLYELLADAPYRERIPWTRVRLFWADERCVPPDHLDSNYRMARETLLDHIRISPNNIHRIRGELPPAQAARAYEGELRSVLGANGRLDLVLLGVGQDGHTASLFPGSDALSERERLAVPVYAEHLKSWRVTLTLPALNRGRHVVFLVSGAGKAPVLARLRAGERLPASLVSPVDGRVTWLVDRAALIG